MFTSTPLKLSRDLYDFKEENKIPTPTDNSLIFGGLFSEWGYKPIFEAPFDKIHVDIYVPEFNPKLLFEINGDREPEQSKVDGKRDGFLVRHQKSVQRIHNETITKSIPPNEQIRLYFKGVNIFIQQLEEWKEYGIPDYLNNEPDNSLTELHQDIIQWFGNTNEEWVN